MNGKNDFQICKSVLKVKTKKVSLGFRLACGLRPLIALLFSMPNFLLFIKINFKHLLNQDFETAYSFLFFMLYAFLKEERKTQC